MIKRRERRLCIGHREMKILEEELTGDRNRW